MAEPPRGLGPGKRCHFWLLHNHHITLHLRRPSLFSRPVTQSVRHEEHHAHCCNRGIWILKEAGVRRIVHVSITNPDSTSALPYFRGKAELESSLRGLGISYCILRPTVLFGKEDVLINNIAWSLRHFPLVGVFGKGDYRLQPIYVDDLAQAAAQKVSENRNEIIEAIGPETFTYRGLVTRICRALSLKRPVISVPPFVGYWCCRLVGLFVGDVVITREEIRGLMEERLYVDAPPLGATRLTDWIDRHRGTSGRRYTSEMARRVDRASQYRSN